VNPLALAFDRTRGCRGTFTVGSNALVPTPVAPDAYKRRAKNPSWTHEQVFIMATGTRRRYTGDITAMTQPVIDTLKLADNLKESGFPDRQAEGLARALGRALTEHVATKADLDAAIRLVRSDITALDTKISALDDKSNALDTRVSALDNKVSALDDKVSALDTKVSALDDKVSALDTKVSALDDKVSALDTKISALLATNRTVRFCST